MKSLIIYTILSLSLILSACGQEKPTGETSPKTEISSALLPPTDEQNKVSASKQTEISPSETYRRYYEAFKKGDIGKIKELSSRKTFASLEKMMKEQGSSIEEMVRHQNSLIPADKQALAVRNEKIDGNRATFEISNPNNGLWVPVLLIVEDGIWKIGDAERFEEIEKNIEEKAKKIKKIPNKLICKNR